MAASHVIDRDVHLRRVESRDGLAPAVELAQEFAADARGRLETELGIVVPAETAPSTAVLDDLLAPGSRLYVAWAGSEAVGVGGLKRLSETDAEVKRMFVRPQARGLGVGRAIVERLVADARELGYRAVLLESAVFMHEAHALYRSAGFAPAGPYPGREFAGAPHDVSIFMRLDLA